MRVFAILAMLMAVTLATKGVDTQFVATVDQLKCIANDVSENPPKQLLITFRAWNGNNTFMQTVHTNLANAKKAGVPPSQIMLYMQPCGSADAMQQVQQMFGNMTDDEKKMVSRIWINVETNPNNGCALSENTTTNC